MTEVKNDQAPKPDNVRFGSVGIEKKKKRYSNNRNNRKGNPKLLQFKGKYEPLHGYVFDYTGPRRMDNYVKTHKEICEYAGCNCKHGLTSDVRWKHSRRLI